MVYFKQRFLHFYCLNELLHILFFVCNWRYEPFANFYVGWSKPVAMIIMYSIFFALNMLVMFVILILRSRTTEAIQKKIDFSKPRYPEEIKFTEFTHTSRDGVELLCRVSADTPVVGNKKNQKVMLLAAPLGQMGPAIYKPIMNYYGDEYVYISWDYRGFFGSEVPKRIRKISIPEHAHDAIDVLKAAGYDKADVMVGHSMGVAVALETVLLYPEAVDALILLNGFHGHVFATAFQPLVRVPLISDVGSILIEKLLQNPEVLDKVRKGLDPVLDLYCTIMAKVKLNSKLLVALSGEDYLIQFFRKYLGTLCSSLSNTQSYIRLFQELNAHSVYHLLYSIQQPVLIVSGFMDTITPPMQSVEMARKMRHATHYCDPFSSHASLLESPERVMAEIEHFVGRIDEGKYVRRTSCTFSQEKFDTKKQK